MGFTIGALVICTAALLLVLFSTGRKRYTVKVERKIGMDQFLDQVQQVVLPDAVSRHTPAVMHVF